MKNYFASDYSYWDACKNNQYYWLVKLMNKRGYHVSPSRLTIICGIIELTQNVFTG